MRLQPLLKHRFAPFAALGLFLIVFFLGLNAAYPLLGHDYFYFFPRMLAGKWHYVSQGLAPLRWSPFLCGGFPVYGNPHDIFYSLPQFLSFFLGLWASAQLSIAAALIAGYLGWRRFGKDVLGLTDAWAHVLALIVIANGYYFMHMMAGHLSYHTLPLIGWLLWFLFEPSRDDRRGMLIKTALFALLSAYIFYAAGYFVLLLGGVAFLCFLPFHLWMQPAEANDRLKKIGAKLAAYAPAALALCISKLVAVWSLMRFFPRLTVFDRFPEGTSGLFFILKSFFLLPQGEWMLAEQQNIWGIHEYSMFLSPVVLAGMAAACIVLWRGRLKASGKMTTMGVFVALLLLFFVQLARGHGLLADAVSGLPIFSSLRVTVRFLYVPALLLSMAGVWGLSAFLEEQRYARWRAVAPAAAAALTIVAFVLAYAPIVTQREVELTLPYAQMHLQLKESKYLNRAVSRVQTASSAEISDFQYLFAGTTGPGCYEPLLKDTALPQPLEDGPVQQQGSGGILNMYNPACLQYPDENGCKPGDRIAAADADNLERFRQGLPTTWTLSSVQRLADAITALGLIACGAVLAVAGYRLIRRNVTGTSVFTRRMRALASGIKKSLRNGWTALTQVSGGSPERFHRFMTVFMIGALLVFVGCICAFHVLDRDFWWHITAGQLMTETWSLIRTEPFAWTRAGLPYVANHEWLAQVVLYLVWAAGGSTGIIVFRTLVIAACMLIVVLIDRRGAWLTAPIAILTAISLQPTSMERPQLFSFIVFSLFLWLTVRVLRITAARPLTSGERLRTAFAFLLLQVIWVNTHGGASVLALLFVAALFADAGERFLRSAAEARNAIRSHMNWIVLLGAIVVVGFFLSPITYENAVYLWDLLTDRTIIYILEWQPREWDQYAKLILPFWFVGAAAVIAGRRNIAASLVLLVPLAFQSLQALRHESFLLLAILAVTVHQLHGSAAWRRLGDWLLRRRTATVVFAALLLLATGGYAAVRYDSFVRADQLHGYGTFDFGKGAADFVEREKIGGKMFNTYGIGGYLIHRGATPHTSSGSMSGDIHISASGGLISRPVFIDGRNVDYGFPFLNLVFLAGRDPVQWKKLQEKYAFTHAVVDYFANKDKEKDRIFYSMILENDPQWPMVYYDDWVAVYLKDIPQNRPVIDRLRYRLINPQAIEYKDLINRVPREQWPELERELRRAAVSDPRSIKARIELTKLLIRQNRLDEAHAAAQDVAIIRPRAPEPHAMFAAIYVAQKKWDTAADELQKMIRKAGPDYPEIDYGFVAQVFAQAGREREARAYAQKAGINLVRSIPSSDSPSASGAILPVVPGSNDVTAPSDTGSNAPMVNPAMDAIEFHDKALEFAQRQQNAEARENFLIAIKLNPSFPEAWNNLATLSFFEGKLDEAKEEYERALKEWPEYPDAHYNLALLLQKLGDKEGAKKHADEATRLGKDASAVLRLIQE